MGRRAIPGGELQLLVDVTVEEGATGPLSNLVDVSGGGARLSIRHLADSQIGGSTDFGPARLLARVERIPKALPDGQAVNIHTS